MSESTNNISPPSRVQVKPTSSCNLRCRTCTLWHTDIESGVKTDSGARRLSDAELGTLIADFASWGVQRLEIADGEPFLRQGTPQLIKQAASLGLNTMAISNGTLIDRALAARLVRDGLNTLIVSLDGPRELHDEIRGVEGTFAKISRAVGLINEEKKRCGSPSPTLIFHTVVSRLNLRRLDEVLEISETLGAAAAAFRYLSQVPPEAVTLTNEALGGEYASPAHHYTVEEDLGIPAEDLPQLGAMLEKLVQTGNRCTVQLALDPLLFDLARENRHVPRSFQGPGCPLVGDFLQISPRGVVHPCPMLTGRGLGSVRNKTVREIFEAPESQALIQRIQDLFPLPICPHCCYREK